MLATTDKTNIIRDLNDRFRNTLDGSLGHVIVTQGVLVRGRGVLGKVIDTVREYSDFTEGNDPYGEHDFGAFDLNGDKYFWKIDYYDNDMAGGSPDPSDPSVTRRVLTIMLAEEY